MHKKLVKYNEWHWAEVDPIRLKRKAIALRDEIEKKISPDHDPYQFYSRTYPIVQAAIRGEIAESLDENVSRFVSANYKRDNNEGTLPPEYDHDFRKAVAGFSVTVQGLSLGPTEKHESDGATYGWLNFEDEGDWPDKVMFP
ncbi:hypothetical protein [Massilia soli]|uniref:Uncharacterized protein n=1 Tax=Massilia soli TaxID=2792854 RepID=A0ABS7SQE5_9BURK|nr:hypothetical protein [Massilia soli]MBZ2207615.1 hypothetical protein [Massilia soli]